MMLDPQDMRETAAAERIEGVLQQSSHSFPTMFKVYKDTNTSQKKVLRKDTQSKVDKQRQRTKTDQDGPRDSIKDQVTAKRDPVKCP